MLSIRSIARGAPRAVARLNVTNAMRTSFARPSTFTKTFSSLNNLVRASISSNARAFSTTVSQRAADGETDDELSAKLESEIQIEEEMIDQEPASIKDFLDNSSYELIDNVGEDIVKLQRTFGEEKITVSFSIADITNYDPYANSDPALEDEADLPETLNPNNSNKQSSPSSSSAREEDLEDEELDDPLDEAPTPISLSIVITKPNKTSGALHVDATAQDGNIVVDNLFFYEDAAVANADTPEAAQKRAEVYPGPPFGSLDEDLQVLMERFLEERGITQAMAVFVPDYVDIKEQREYARWLSNVKGFIDA